MKAIMSIKKRAEKPPRFEVKAENIPERLRSQKRWLMWSWEWNGAKWDKPPLAVDGGAGSSTNAATWVTFDEAVAASPRFDGIGFAMGKTGCGLVGVDIDNCRNPVTGEITAEARRIIEDLDTYTEVSPSGEGVKMWLDGSIEDTTQWKCKNEDAGIEVYFGGRYFTVTGHSVGPAKPVAKVGGQLNRLLRNYMQKNDVFKKRPKDPSYTMECAKEALKFIDANCGYEEWIDVGMALKWLDDSLFSTWVQWSHTAERDRQASEEKCRSHWESFPGAKGGVAIGTVFWLAGLNGYVIPPMTYEASDYGVARRVRDYADGRALYIPEWKEWYVWNGRAFVKDTVNFLADAIVTVSKQMMAEIPKSEEVDTGDEKEDKKVNEENAKRDKAWQSFCMRYQSCRSIFDVKKLCQGLMAFDYRGFDRNAQILHCQNVALHLQTDGSHCALAHGMENLNTIVSEIVYDPDAECPRWEQFIREITGGDQNLADYLQRIAGYCLTGLSTEQVLFVLHGEGQNGKGVFTRTLLKLLGDYAGPVSQELLMASPNQHPTIFADLYGKRVVVAQETDQDCRLNENQVKMLTGGDIIHCRRMHENFWSFEPTHKIMLATNHVPLIRGTDNGIWRRIKLIPFRVNFTEQQKDPQLEQKLHSELSGILNWALNGWSYYCWEQLAEPLAVTNARSEYREEMSVVRQFVDDKCIAVKGASVRSCDLYQNFKLYCELHGHYAPSARKFGIDLTQMGFPAGRTSRERLRQGLKLIDAELPQTKPDLFAEA